MSNDQLFWTYFHELYESIPRQGPGLDEFTLKALKCLPALQKHHRILDIGCGSGKQTLELARRCEAQIVATDVHVPFLETLRHLAKAEGFEPRISIQVADMGNLPFADAEFDVVWAEGSSFIIGFANGLKAWKRLVKPGGHMVVSELTFETLDVPRELREFCVPDPEEDPTLPARRQAISDAGLKLECEFALPYEGWWETYYVPLLERLPEFERRHAEHPEALVVVDRVRQEVELFKRYNHLYGYTFFVMSRT